MLWIAELELSEDVKYGGQTLIITYHIILLNLKECVEMWSWREQYGAFKNAALNRILLPLREYKLQFRFILFISVQSLALGTHISFSSLIELISE